jgi:hypothetical protein
MTHFRAATSSLSARELYGATRARAAATEGEMEMVCPPTNESGTTDQ